VTYSSQMIEFCDDLDLVASAVGTETLPLSQCLLGPTYQQAIREFGSLT